MDISKLDDQVPVYKDLMNDDIESKKAVPENVFTTNQLYENMQRKLELKINKSQKPRHRTIRVTEEVNKDLLLISTMLGYSSISNLLESMIEVKKQDFTDEEVQIYKFLRKANGSEK